MRHTGLLANGDTVDKSLQTQMLAYEGVGRSFDIPEGPDLVVQPVSGTKFCYDEGTA